MRNATWWKGFKTIEKKKEKNPTALLLISIEQSIRVKHTSILIRMKKKYRNCVDSFTSHLHGGDACLYHIIYSSSVCHASEVTHQILVVLVLAHNWKLPKITATKSLCHWNWKMFPFSRFLVRSLKFEIASRIRRVEQQLLL